MLLSELFRIHNVECPDWLSNQFIEDELINAYYTLEEGMHKWTLKNPLKHVVLSFDGNIFKFEGYSEDGNDIIFEEIITKDEVHTS